MPRRTGPLDRFCEIEGIVVRRIAIRAPARMSFGSSTASGCQSANEKKHHVQVGNSFHFAVNGFIIRS
jgi:hypothetical protein